MVVVPSGALLLAACGGGNGGMGGMNHGAMGNATATTGGASAPGMPSMNHGAMGTATVAAAAEYDQGFIDLMVPHHQAAVEMARVAQRKAEHPEIKQLADAIIADQDREIGQMKAWRKAWYGSDQIPTGGMAGHSMGGMNVDMAQLEGAQPFDRAFIDAMIPHHQSAIEMAREAQTKVQRPEIKQLAGEIIAAQQREIDQMRSWRAQWYPGQ